MRNIGGPRDRVAEVFGIVVDDDFRRLGIGTGLLEGLVVQLGDSADFILCEARTADAGGWMVARSAGFVPVGFEAYAHAMPVGFESMVLAARGRWLTGPRPAPQPRLPGPASRLADVVLGGSPAADSLSAAAARQPSPQLGADLTIRRDDAAGRAWFDANVAAGGHRSGILDLHPIVGRDRQGVRYDNGYFIGEAGSSPLACLKLTWDRTDQRARILGLRTRSGVLPGAVLNGAVRELDRLASPGPLTILVTLRADASELQPALEGLDFRPTAYLPGLLSGPADAVQYTRLRGRSWRDSTAGVTALAWPEARQVIRQVLGDDFNAAAL
jgi:hypothetical protein